VCRSFCCEISIYTNNISHFVTYPPLFSQHFKNICRYYKLNGGLLMDIKASDIKFILKYHCTFQFLWLKIIIWQMHQLQNKFMLGANNHFTLFWQSNSFLLAVCWLEYMNIAIVSKSRKIYYKQVDFEVEFFEKWNLTQVCIWKINWELLSWCIL
jgi:hypothetical protein